MTHYLRDPLRFYEERVLGIEPILSSESMVSHKDQGTILHAVLESLFTPFQNRDLSEKDYDQMLEKLPKVLEAQFESIYGNCSSLQGKIILSIKYFWPIVIVFYTMKKIW